MSGDQGHPQQPSAPKAERRQLFISYSHRDSAWVERLRTMLRPLEQRYGLERWDDSRIQPGSLWRQEIEKALGSAQVALLLVSSDFLASAFVTRSELPPLFHAAKEEGLRILWVPLRPCLWQDIPEIEQFQAVIHPGRTVAEMSEVEQERAFVQIAQEIKTAFQEEAERQARAIQEQEERRTREKEKLQREAEERLLSREREEQQRRQAEREERLQRYEQEFRRAIEGQFPLDSFVLEGLRRFQQQLELRDEEVARLQEPLVGARKSALRKAQEELRAREEEDRRRQEVGSRSGETKPASSGPPVLIQAQSARLVQDSTSFSGRPKWRTELKMVEVEGYREDLGDGVALTIIRIPAGWFVLGSPKDAGHSDNERPQHPVRMEGFFLAQTPITQAQWKVVAGWPKVERDLHPDPSRFKGANNPVEQVSWFDAMEFCSRLSQRTGLTYTLPSEAQWEYACRSGTTTPFSFGATITPELANYNGNYAYDQDTKGEYRKQTTPVGSFPANAWGLQDMHGNVLEWCLDRWHGSYEGAPADGSAWTDPEAGEDVSRLLRGGSWSNSSSGCRSACRDRFRPGYRNGSVGFRVCCLPPGSGA